jgi:beta-1,4-mannooligosaccharide/beta-1,4-mannosyl-N-acetylglucosamine phosphorylase
MNNTIKRYVANPVLTANDVPYQSNLIFNAGVCKYQEKYIMIFRNDFGINKESFSKIDHKPGDKCPFETNLGLASSDDGISWKVQSTPFWNWKTEEIHRVYDPRLSVIDDELFICFAIDTQHGIRGGIGIIHDLKHVEVLHVSIPDNRNMVLFPEKINGKYFRLERPFTVYSRGGVDRFDLWSGSSPDLEHWGNFELVLGVEDVPFANDKIGPAAPPVKTSQGWLTTFHAVKIDKNRNLGGWEREWYKEYSAGLMLLDLHNPTIIKGIYKGPLLSPETEYELYGFRNNVIFPGGMILEKDGEVKIYYGAADAVVALATAHVSDLLSLCLA